MKKLENYFSENKIVLISLFIGIIVVFGTFIIGNEEFILGYDFRNQHIYFYEEFYRLIHSGQMPFWSNNILLGTNFFASKSYYLLGDPYAYTTLFFSIENIAYAILVSYLLKYITAALMMNQYLKKIGIQAKVRAIPVVMYTFCGWSALFAEHPMFLTWFALLPMLLLGIERVLQDKKYATFTLAVFFILLSNYYFFWTSSIFLTFYWTIRYYQKYTFRFKEYFLATIKLIGYYLIGVLMTMFLILPSILHLLKNERLSSDFLVLMRWTPYSIYLDLIVKSLIAPFSVTGFQTTIFNTVNYTTKDLSLFSGVFSLLILPQMMFVLKGKKRNGYLILIMIELCLLLTPFGSSIMHGFQDATFRWALLYIFTIVIIVSEVLNASKINKKILLYTSLIIAGIILTLISFAYISNRVTGLNNSEIYALLLSFVLIFSYFFLIFHKKSKLIYIFIMSELLVGSYLTYHRIAPTTMGTIDNNLSWDVVNYIKTREGDNFYRIYYVFSDTITAPYNVNLHYNFKGNYTYDSLFQFPLKPFLRTLDTYNDGV